MKDILAKLTLLENVQVSELKAGDKYGDDATAIGRGDTGEVWPLGEGAKYSPATPYGVQYKVFAGKEQRLTTKEAWFKSAEAMERGIKKIEDLGNFYEIVGHHYPEDMAKESTYDSGGADEFSGSGSAQVNEAPKGSTEELSVGDRVMCRDPNKSLYGEIMTVKKIINNPDGDIIYCGGKNLMTLPYKRKHLELLHKAVKPEVSTESIDVNDATQWLKTDKLWINWKGKNLLVNVKAANKDLVEIEYNGKKRIMPLTTLKKIILDLAPEEKTKQVNEAPSQTQVKQTHADLYNYHLQKSKDNTMSQQEREKHKNKAEHHKKLADVKESKLTEKSKSKKQAKFMAACAHGAGYKSCPPTSVAKEFNRADQKAGTLKNESENDDLAGDDFIDDETYNRLKKHVATKHPGYSVHGLGQNEKGGVNWQAFHKNDKHFTKPIHGVFDEGIGQTLKKVGKSIKRGAQLWDKDLTGSPRDVVTRNKSYSDKELLSLRGKEGEKPVKHSPRHLQNRVIDKEIKKRGLGETECPTCKDTGTINYKGVSVPCSSPTCKTKTPVKEVAPKGWEGTVKKMKKHKEIDNPWALANYMKDKGYKSHQKESKENKMKNLKESILTEDPGLERVLRHFGKEVRDFQEYGSLDDHLYNALYDYWFDDMPYGVKKARDGDPYEWIEEKLYSELGGIGAKANDEHALSGVGAFGEGAAGDAPVYGSGNDISPLTTNNLEEGHMSEVDIVMRDIADGVRDVYTVMAHPQDPTEEAASHILQDMFDTIAIDSHLHPDDDTEEICDRIADQLQKDYADGDFENLEIDLNKHGIEQDRDYSDADLEEGEGSAGYDWHQQMATQAAKPSAPANPALSAKIAAAKAAARAANAAAPAGGAMPQPVLKRPGQPAVGETMDEAMDETFLIEGLEGVITEILEEHGLDHGLDFFFDNGLVAIGKSTARVIINALKADPRIKATPSFGRIDGEEVQIVFDKQPKSPVKDLHVDEIPPAEFNPEEPNRLGESDINEEVSLSLTATGEEDALNVIRKLSGLATVDAAPETNAVAAEPEEIEVIEPVDEALSDDYFIVDGDTLEILEGPMDSVTAGDNLNANYRKYPEAEVCSGAELEQKIASKNSVEEDEGEYVNAPDPTVHTSTTDMINRGNDLNRPKRQDYTIRNLGNNPMAETRKLFKQYEALKDDVKK